MGHVAYVGWKRNANKASVSGVHKEGDQLENLGVDGKIMLK